jgi:hypothetical protein
MPYIGIRTLRALSKMYTGPRHLLALLCLSLGLASSNAHDAPTATINAGLVVGKTTSLPNALGLVNQFLGVPFASPPERFSPPKPPAARFEHPLNATAWKPACIQQFRCMCCLYITTLTGSD